VGTAANPNLSVKATFSYKDSNVAAGGEDNCAQNVLENGGTCDALDDVTVALPPGLIANPEEVPALCTAAELQAYSCPATSEIGSGPVAVYDYDTDEDGVDGSQTLHAYLYMMPAPSSTTLAGIGMVIELSTTPIISVSGTAVVNEDGQVQVSFDGLPTQAALGGPGAPLEYAQVTSMSLTFDGIVDGNPFITTPAGCRPETSTLTSSDYQDTTPLASSSTYLPAGC
jgi:hypothetical protein